MDLLCQKIYRIVNITESNLQISNYVQQQFDKLTSFVIQKDEGFETNRFLGTNALQNSQYLTKILPDAPPDNKVNIESINSIFSLPNQFSLTQNVIQGLVKQEVSTEKDRVKQKLSGFDPKLSPACIYINKNFGTDLRQPTLCEFAKKIAKKRKLILDRDAKRRKTVLFKWFHDNWDIIRPDFENTKFIKNTLITNDQQDDSRQSSQDETDGLHEF